MLANANILYLFLIEFLILFYIFYLTLNVIIMIEEFIEANELKAEIISFPTETPVSVAIKQKKFNPKNIIQTNLFISAKKEEILTINHPGKNPQIEVLEKLIGEDLLETNEEECLSITGYKKHFLPPISIFGIKVIIDSSLEKLSYLVFPLSTKKYLKIPLEEILSSNEDIVFEKLS